jgi:hypothetical protein
MIEIASSPLVFQLSKNLLFSEMSTHRNYRLSALNRFYVNYIYVKSFLFNKFSLNKKHILGKLYFNFLNKAF